MRSLFIILCLFLFATQTQSQQSAKPQLEQKLIEAIKANNFPLAKKLLQKGANPDAQDKNDNTALIYAIYRGNDKMVLLLLSNGANPNKTGEEKEVPICLAAFGGHPSIVSALLSKGASAKAHQRGKHTALIMATWGSFAASLPKVFRDKNIMEGMEDSSSHFLNPLMEAHREVVRMLISNGADINVMAECDLGETALRFAAVSCDVVLVKELLARGAKPTEDEFDWHGYFERGFEEPGKVKVPALSKSQQAVLEWFQKTASARLEIRKLLINAGAKETEKNEREISTEELAEEIADDAFTETIEANDLKEFIRLTNAYSRDAKYKKFLYSLFWSLTVYNCLEMVKYLISKGYDVNWSDENGRTPLMYAAQNGVPEIVKVLLAAGADVNKKDKESHTALFFAKSWADQIERFKQIVKILKANGAIEQPN